MAEPKSNKQVGIFVATSLVVGGMIGSGIFTLPSALAAFGGISLLGWLISALGALVLAFIFGKVSKVIPHAGGPYAYTRSAFGDFPAFIVGWGYWLSIWATNSAIALTFTGYLSIFFPALSDPINTIICCLTVVWLLTTINSRSVKAGGSVQLITTVLKIIPLLVISFIGIFSFNPDHFNPFILGETSSLKAITISSALCLFAFMGLEAASIPAANIKNPEKNISKATISGVVLVIFIYLFSSISLFGILPPDEVQNSLAPFSDAAEKLFGGNAKYFVAAGACISTFGALNGWILIQGQMPMAMAMNQSMPKIFAKRNKNDTPTAGIIITSILLSALLFFNQSRSFSNLYSFMVLLTTVTVLISYLATTLVYGYFVWKRKFSFQPKLKTILIFGLGIIFSIWMIIGSGLEAVIWGFLGVLLGIPVYLLSKRKQK